MSRAKAIVILDCNHTVLADINDARRIEFRCKMCDEVHTLISIQLREWYVKCYNCQYGKYTGNSEETARRLVHRHEIKTSHKVLYQKKINPTAYRLLKEMERRGQAVEAR